MSMHKYMHPRNKYKTRPDFRKLALEFPDFRKHAKQNLSGKVEFNFKEEGAVWSLTKCLLKKDFCLDVEIVTGRLAPTLPLRLNYIHWIEDLLALYRSASSIIGIDIGTGACCIYPLLAAKLNAWEMIGTEIDSENYECASANVEKNSLQNLIKVVKVKCNNYLCGVLDPEKNFSFCMCNPPFFDESDENDKPKDRTGKRSQPRNAHSGLEVELKTDGGEIAFVKSIINDSLKLKDKIKIYTTMLGHKSSLVILTDYLKDNNIPNVSNTIFCQGRTVRWGLAWSYDNTIQLHRAEIKISKKFETYMRSERFDLKNENYTEITDRLLNILCQLEIEVEGISSDEDVQMYLIKAPNHTWANARKKRRQKNLEIGLSQEKSQNSSEKEMPLPCNKRKLDSATDMENKRFKGPNCDGEYVLECSFAFRNLGDAMLLEVIFIGGSKGKDAMNQLLVYLKNSIVNFSS